MLGGSAVGYARMTRRWWAPVRATMAERAWTDRPMYFVSSNPHSMANLVSGTARRREAEMLDWVRDGGGRRTCAPSSRPSGGPHGGLVGELPLLLRARTTSRPHRGELKEQRSEEERAVGITPHLLARPRCACPRRSSRSTGSTRGGWTRGWADVDADSASPAPRRVIVNIEYPLGLAAYNILREITEAHDTLRGVYVLGKAATLNADVGDVMISSVIHDEHSGSTYWLDNAFSVDDIAPYLVFGSGLDNQRAVTVKSTFLQNREYLDFYYREAFTVVEMEAGPYCNAVYEIADVDRYPVGEAVNFSKLPIDFGIIHYASDTPYTQARTLGARGLSYYGMDSTYASSLAILRRVSLEGA